MSQIERLYRDLAETSNDLIWAVDADGRITFMSAACRKIYGREPEEMIGRSFLEFVPPDQYQKDLLYFTEALQSGQETVDYISRVYRKDGSIVTLSANARIVYDEQGRVIGGYGISRDMTDSLRAREALERSDREQRELVAQLETERARLVAAQAAAKVGDWEIDLATLAVTWSREMYRIVEMDPDRWSPTPQGALSLVHPEDRAAVEEACSRSLAERVPRTLVHRLSMPDGRVKFVDEQWQIVCDERGEPVRAAGACQDITERRQAEATATRLAAIVQSSGDAIVGKELNSIITNWNYGAETIFGYAADEIIGTSMMRLIPADRLDEESVILGKIKRGERVEHFETQRQTKDGRLIDVSVTASPIKDATGQVVGVSTLARDITERKEAEIALADTNKQYRMLFESSLDAILLTDDSGQYVDVNPAACELFGAPREALLASRVPDMATPENAAAFDQQWRTFLTAGEQSGEYTIRRPDGTTRDVEFRAVAHVLPGTHLAILRDVTERVRLDRVRRQYLQRLEILSAIDHAILDARSIMTVADAIVRMVGTLFPTIRVSLMLFDWRTRTARHVAVWSQGPTHLSAGTEMAMRGDVVGPEVLEGRSVIRSHLEGQTDLTWLDQMLFNEGVRSLLRVPLKGTAEVIGALNISSAENDGFDQDTHVVAQEVADRVAIAITSARLFEDLQAGAAHLAAVSKRLIEVQEVERRDVARELHDEIGQLLTGVRLRLDLAVKEAAPPIAESLAECVELVQDLLSRVRRLSLNLRPPLLDELGLEKALVAHFERYTAQTSVHVAFSSSGLANKRLPVLVETAAFRIVQESLTNIARHASVEHATVEVRVADNRVYVTVADRGRGFTADISTPAGAGLSGMQERIALLGGLFHVSSAPDEGTTVEAQIPFLEPEGSRL